MTLLFLLPAASRAGGPFGIDFYVHYDDGGIWERGNQQALIDAMIAADVGLALWEGGDSRLGKTSWQSIDGTTAAGLASIVLKKAFSRVRPSDTTDPNLWFKGHGNASFPSGEVTVTSAIVAPYVFEYAHDHPAVYALELLPIYDAIARVKVHGHWPSDVVAGFALGTVSGYFAHKYDDPPISLRFMPHGIQIGLKRNF